MQLLNDLEIDQKHSVRQQAWLSISRGFLVLQCRFRGIKCNIKHSYDVISNMVKIIAPTGLVINLSTSVNGEALRSLRFCVFFLSKEFLVFYPKDASQLVDNLSKEYVSIFYGDLKRL